VKNDRTLTLTLSITLILTLTLTLTLFLTLNLTLKLTVFPAAEGFRPLSCVWYIRRQYAQTKADVRQDSFC